MECSFHPGKEAEFSCLKCRKGFCRLCVQETNQSHYCPDCYRGEVQNFVSRMVPSREKAKVEKAPRGASEKAYEKDKERKVLRRPAERPIKLPQSTEVLKEEEKPSDEKEAVVEELEPSLSPEEREAFWGEMERARGFGWRREQRETESSVPKARVVPESEKGRELSEEEREKSILQAEGFPEKAVVGKQAAKKGVLPHEIPITLQFPDEYRGEITPAPNYGKAILFAVVAGILGAGVYGGLAWWLKREFGIIAFLLGFAVGIAVVLGSGRHFSPWLGAIAAAIAMVFVSAGRIFTYMLGIWFPPIKILSVSTSDNFTAALSKFAGEFFSPWLIYFVIAGLVAFLLSFRPWPIRVEVSGKQETHRTARSI
ncbi:MAG: hypothetical protein PHO53_00225 [Actinomycetota bacterium]|nr:hypothetical protein [Actinomycetota bacterium]